MEGLSSANQLILQNFIEVYKGKYQVIIMSLAVIEELKRQNSKLNEENFTLRQSLEELIAVNTQLTQSIEDYSTQNNLESQILSLQNQNRSLKNQLHQTIRSNEQLQKELVRKSQVTAQSHSPQEYQEMEMIIKQLYESSKQKQISYEGQIVKLTSQLMKEKRVWEESMKNIEWKYQEKILEYENTIKQLQLKNQGLSQQFEKKILKQSQQIHNEERRSMKVSTTIEDLRQVLERQIQQKEKTIRVYEDMVLKLKTKLKEKY